MILLERGSPESNKVRMFYDIDAFAFRVATKHLREDCLFSCSLFGWCMKSDIHEYLLFELQAYQRGNNHYLEG